MRLAIESGKLAPAATRVCIRCAKDAAMYHHPRGYDDAHALDVEPYCRSCHRLAHDAEWRAGLAQRWDKAEAA